MKEYNQAGRWSDQLRATYKCLNEVVIDTFEELNDFEKEYDKNVGTIWVTCNDYPVPWLSKDVLNELYHDVGWTRDARVRIGVDYSFREVYLLRAGKGGEHVTLGYDKMYDLLQVLALLENGLKKKQRLKTIQQ